MASILAARFVFYLTPGDDSNSVVLPTPVSWSWASPLNDTPTLTLVYNRGVGTLAPYTKGMLAANCDVAIEFSWGGFDWHEPNSGRFAIVEETFDPDDPYGTATITAVGIDSFDLDGLYYISNTGNESGICHWGSAAVGKPIYVMMNEGRSGNYSMAKNLIRTFDADRDSAGAKWAYGFAAYNMSLTSSAWDILQDFVDAGFCDYTYHGNTLNIYNPGAGLQRDLSLSSLGEKRVVLLPGRDYQSGPVTWSRRDGANRAFGLVGTNQTVTQQGSGYPLKPRGDRMAVVEGSYDTAADLKAAAKRSFANSISPRAQLVRDLSLATAAWLPVRDYQPGDLVYTQSANLIKESVRVMQLTLSGTKDGVGGSVTLGDRFLVREVKNWRKVKRVHHK